MRSQIFAVEPENVKGYEMLRRPTTEERVKLGFANGVKVNDLAIQDRISNLKTVGKGAAKTREGFVDVASPRKKAQTAVLNVGQRPETVILRLEYPVGVIKRLSKHG